MTSRERVITALKHKEPDILPWDLGGMRSTGIMGIAYINLRERLGLRIDYPRIYDVGQQLAWIDEDVRSLLGIDVIALDTEKVLADRYYGWRPYNLPNGAPALIPAYYRVEYHADGSRLLYNDLHILASRPIASPPIAKMPAKGFYFDSIRHELENAQSVEDIEKWEMETYSERELNILREEAKRLYENTDYAIMGSFGGNIIEGGQTLMGWENFMSALLGNRKLVEALIEKLVDGYLRNLELYLSAVGDYIQIIQMGDDLGTQTGPQLSPKLYKELISPAHKKIYQFVHEKKPNIFVFLHSCGSVYEFIPFFIEEGVDILNPVQISAVNMEPEKLKREFGRDIVFWGGGCDTQRVLPFGTPQEVYEHTREMIRIFSPGGGFVFCQVHNIQANVPVENILAMFKAVQDARQGV